MELLSATAYGAIKLSILFFYRRLFVVSKRTSFDTLTASLIVITIIWALTFFFGFIFICGTSLSANWGSRIDLATHCGHRHTLTDGYLTSDLGIDVLLLSLYHR